MWSRSAVVNLIGAVALFGAMAQQPALACDMEYYQCKQRGEMSCEVRRQYCEQRRRGGGEDPNRPTNAAIAYDKYTGGSGWSWNQPSAAAARQAALAQCRPNGARCEIIAEIGYTCGAFAMDQATKAYGWGYAKPELRPQDQQYALAACRKGGGKSCKIVGTFCSM